MWHSSLTEENISDIERVQKSAIKVILDDKYNGYLNGLSKLGLENLNERREHLCEQFATKCVKNQKLKHMFPKSENKHEMETRNKEVYLVEHANTERFQKSAIIYMQKLLNKYETEQNKSWNSKNSDTYLFLKFGESFSVISFALNLIPSTTFLAPINPLHKLTAMYWKHLKNVGDDNS